MADPINAEYATIASYLRSVGLGALVGVDANGNPSGWLWNKLQSGVDTGDELSMAIEQTDVWRNEYGVIVEQRARAARGEPVQVMTVDEVVAYRDSAKQVMRNAGLPAWFYDDAHDFDHAILNGQSVSELADRLGDAYMTVAQTDPTIRQAFEDFYGVGQGDGALAAYFLDPQRTQASLQKASRAAFAAGMGTKYGIKGMTRSQAEDIALFAPTEAQVNQGLGQVAALGTVTTDSLFDGNQVDQQDAINSVFKNDALATREINKRITERRAANTNAIGGAALTNEGLIGAGAAR